MLPRLAWSSTPKLSTPFCQNSSWCLPVFLTMPATCCFQLKPHLPGSSYTMKKELQLDWQLEDLKMKQWQWSAYRVCCQVYAHRNWRFISSQLCSRQENSKMQSLSLMKKAVTDDSVCLISRCMTILLRNCQSKTNTSPLINYEEILTVQVQPSLPWPFWLLKHTMLNLPLVEASSFGICWNRWKIRLRSH